MSWGVLGVLEYGCPIVSDVCFGACQCVQRDSLPERSGQRTKNETHTHTNTKRNTTEIFTKQHPHTVKHGNNTHMPFRSNAHNTDDGASNVAAQLPTHESHSGRGVSDAEVVGRRGRGTQRSTSKKHKVAHGVHVWVRTRIACLSPSAQSMCVCACVSINFFRRFKKPTHKQKHTCTLFHTFSHSSTLCIRFVSRPAHPPTTTYHSPCRRAAAQQ